MQRLQVSRKFKNSERFRNIRDKNHVSVLALEIIELVFNSNNIILSDYHHCPSFLMNIIFIGLLAKDGFIFSIKSDFCDVIMNDVTIMSGQLRNGIYVLSQSVNVMYTPNKYPKLDNIIDVYLWYCRLSHINKNRMNTLRKEGILEVNDYELLPTYESCLLEKMIKSSFIRKGERASDVLGLVYIDVCGPTNISARDGYYISLHLQMIYLSMSLST